MTRISNEIRYDLPDDTPKIREDEMDTLLLVRNLKGLSQPRPRLDG